MVFSRVELDFIVNELSFDKQLLTVLKSEPNKEFSISDIAKVLDVDCDASQNRVKFYSTLEDLTYKNFITSNSTTQGKLYKISAVYQ